MPRTGLARTAARNPLVPPKRACDTQRSVCRAVVHLKAGSNDVENGVSLLHKHTYDAQGFNGPGLGFIEVCTISKCVRCM